MAAFLGNILSLSMTLASATLLGPAVLAPADSGVLEGVEERRARNGWGLDGLSRPGVVLVAVEDCQYLGQLGLLLVEGVGMFEVRVVDCQQTKHLACCALSDRELLADVNRADLGHQRAMLMLGWTGRGEGE